MVFAQFWQWLSDRLNDYVATQVAAPIALSRHTMRTIKQNLVGAFAYNITLIPLAAGVLYPLWGVTLDPILAAAAMAASSVTVVGNALRLRGFRQPATSSA